MEPVVVLAVVLVVGVAGGWVCVGGAVVVDVEVGVGGVGEAVWEVGGAAGTVALEVDFVPPQPATTTTHRRTASPLTFAG
jgi:hypothetical protein